MCFFQLNKNDIEIVNAAGITFTTGDFGSFFSTSGRSAIAVFCGCGGCNCTISAFGVSTSVFPIWGTRQKKLQPVKSPQLKLQPRRKLKEPLGGNTKKQNYF